MVKIRLCAEAGCKNVQTSKDYCRLHYLKNWKRIHEGEKKKAAQRLNKYVEGICKKYPDRFVEAIRTDIRRENFPESSDGGGGGDFFSRDEVEDLFDNLGYKNDEAIDDLLTRIKVDKNY